jgi:hypothetical protein
MIFIPRDLSSRPGQVLNVPVMLTNTDTQAITVDSFEIIVSIDPGVFRWNRGRFAEGILTRYDARQGVMIIAGLMPETRLEPGETITLTTLALRVSPRAETVDQALNLLDEHRVGREHFRTSLNGGGLVLIPAPTASPDDPVDGRVRLGRTVQTERPLQYPKLSSRTAHPVGRRPRPISRKP